MSDSVKTEVYYRTVIQVEILSDGPYAVRDLTCDDLAKISRDTTYGACSGKVTVVVDNEPKTADETAALLEVHGEDPEFLLGEDYDDETPRRYRVGVYFRGESGMDHPRGIWEGTADSRDEAERKALDAYDDPRIDGWFVKFLDVDDEDEEEEE